VALAQDVHAGAKAIEGSAKVKVMRQGHHHPVNPAEGIPVIRGDRGNPERMRELPRPV